MENLKKRQPDLYSSRHMCKRCERSPEILSHLWNCEEVYDIIKIIKIIKDKKFILPDKIYTWDNKGSLDDLLSGYITLDLIQQLYKITRSNSKARKLAISLANIVNKELFEKNLD
ncbi:23746_t:CDS:2 [Entrophospora sp. SA101]|nr:9646_t:CDS:2 [Entrophospora sp. SA101]CAJ0751644.1 3714_t:CDS:2 [Entrophospora sp. SA101]CAJ0752405.1 12412_t:CDS:2 [Entrophospora sp. SA101]CAJ0754516.1 23746_t:CDS:2 [Entrophospora sp. SA101]CAJ0844082.1 1012_t:CDS:2 [Entrophospora sp. SA101]